MQQVVTKPRVEMWIVDESRVSVLNKDGTPEGFHIAAVTAWGGESVPELSRYGAPTKEVAEAQIEHLQSRYGDQYDILVTPMEIR